MSEDGSAIDDYGGYEEAIWQTQIMVSMKLNSTYNAMRSLMRRIVGAGLCLAAIACSKESKELPEPQDGIIPTKVVFDILLSVECFFPFHDAY